MVYKAYGCIVVDTETKSIKSVHIPVILDLVQDRVRSRLYSVLLVLLIVIAAGYWALGPALRFAHITPPPLEVAKVGVVLPESVTVTYGGLILPPPMLMVMATDGTLLADRSVYVEIVPVGTDDMDEFMTWQYQSTQGGTFQLQTNNAGTVLFTNLTFSGNPNIQYSLYFVCENVYSDIIPVTITTDVSYLSFAYLPIYPLTPTIGSPIDYTFTITVNDAHNNTLAGRKVIANINPFPEPQINFPRYGTLSGAEAITDENGQAFFSNITILMVNKNTLSLQFLCEGVLLTPTFSELSITFVTNVAQLEVTVPPQANITEGALLDHDIFFMVLDANGNPIAGKYVTAMITTANGVSAYPKVYTLSKILYAQTSEATDENGQTSLSEMTFSIEGRAGLYGITFFCDGVPSVEFFINVTTTVATVQWLSTPPQTLRLQFNSPYILDFVSFSIKTLDSSNTPIQNKIVVLAALYDWGTATIGIDVTDESGIATIITDRIPYYDSLNFTFVAICDGVKNYVSVTLQPNSTNHHPDVVFIYLQAIVPPSGSYSTSNFNGVQPLLRVVDYAGYPIPNFPVAALLLSDDLLQGMYPYYAPYYGTPLAMSYSMHSVANTDENGYVQYGANNNTRFGFTGGATGSVLLSFYLPQGYGMSEAFVLQVESPVNEVTLSHGIVNYNPNNYPARPLKPLNLTIAVALTDDSLQGRSDIYPSLLVMSGPVYGAGLMSLFNGSGFNLAPIIIGSQWASYRSNIPCSFNSSLGTCTFGDISMNGFDGAYAVVVEVAGVLSNALTITMALSGTIHPQPAVVSSYNMSLQQLLAYPTYVTLLNASNLPMAGVYLNVAICDHPEITIINPAAIGCTQCSISSQPTDENGNTVWNALEIINGQTGVYQLCFYLGLPEEQNPPTYWDLPIYLFNPITVIDVVYNQGVLTPGTIIAFKMSIVIQATRQFPLDASLEITDGTTSLALQLQNPTCTTNVPCDLEFSIPQQGVDGYYTAVVQAGGVYSDSFTVVLNSIPASIALDATDTGEQDLMLFQPLTLNINAFSKTKVIISDFNYSITIINQPDGSVPASLYSTQTWVPNTGSILNIIFTAGVSGRYEVLIMATPLVFTSIFVTLTNQIQNITVVNADKLKQQIAIVSEIMSVQPILQVNTIPGYKGSMEGRPITAVLLNTTGHALQYYDKPTVNAAGMAQFTDLVMEVAVPGTYYLQFQIDGIVSEAIPIQLENPAYPNFEHLNLHHTQVKVVLAVLLVIPLFIGNSGRQPSWQLVISIPALAVIGYIAYSNILFEVIKRQRIITLGYGYYALDMSMRGILAATVIVFLAVVGMVIYGWIKKRPASFFETKMNACQPYIRHELLAYGMKRYNENQKGKEQQEDHVEHVPLLARVKRSFASFFAKRKTRKPYTAFFFPQRLFIGFGTSLVCAFFVSCGMVVLSNYLSQLFDSYLGKTLSIISVLEQLNDFMQVGGSNQVSRQQLFSVSDLVQISPERVVQLATQLKEETKEAFGYMHDFENELRHLKKLFMHSSLIAVGISAGIVVISWFFVFMTYKKRVMYLRKGRMDMMTRNTHQYTIDRAAVYVGLQAVHASVGYFILWTLLTLCIIAVQNKAFWEWVKSYYPVLVAFLLGVPFISKTITKFIVSQWVLKNEVILHLRIYLIFDFMWIFVNMLSSIVLSVIRLGFSIISSIIYAMRMDSPLLRDEYDYMDFGFRAYLGMMLMDHKNNNPVLLQFSSILIKGMKLKRKERKDRILAQAKNKMKHFSQKHEILPLLTPVEDSGMDSAEDKTRSRIINKWWLLITLHNNPSLIPLRRH